MTALVNHDDVADTLSVDAEASLGAALEQTLADPAVNGEGVVIIQDDLADVVGFACFTTRNLRSRIAGINTLVIDPGARGRGHATSAITDLTRQLVEDRGFHRVEAETYAFNEAARRAFTRAGFVEEGIRRRAYDRHGAWQDGAMFGFVSDP